MAAAVRRHPRKRPPPLPPAALRRLSPDMRGALAQAALPRPPPRPTPINRAPRTA